MNTGAQTFMCAKTQTDKDLFNHEELIFGGEDAKEETHVFKEREQCQRPNNGAEAPNDIILGRYRTSCGPDSVEDIQR